MADLISEVRLSISAKKPKSNVPAEARRPHMALIACVQTVKFVLNSCRDSNTVHLYIGS